MDHLLWEIIRILTLILTGIFSHLFTVNFSLSNEVSSQHIRLFDDARRLTYEHDSLHASLDGGTLKYFASWGDQSFTSGKQYWEMLVDSSWDWAVGVCKDSWIRKDDGILDKSNRDNFLLVCVKQDDHYQLWTTAPTTPLYIERPLGRVGVFLDCDSGSISFVDVAKRTLLWRYNDGVCTFPVRPFFCTGHRWGSESRPRWDAQDSFSGGPPCPLQLIKETSWSLGSFYCNGASFIVIWCEDSVKCTLHLVVLHIADNKFFSCYHVSRIYAVGFHFLYELPKFTTIWSCASHFLELNTGTQNLHSIGRPGHQPGLRQPADFSCFLIIYCTI